MYAVRAMGGLCNRLRVVLSYHARFGPLRVYWAPDGEIAGARWGDVFEPLPGVTFSDDGGSGMWASDPYPDAPVAWPELYRQVRLLPGHMAALARARPAVPYAAMHIRRTDLVHMATQAGVYEPDEAYVAWAQAAPAHCYLATDNGATQRHMLAALAAMGHTAYHAGEIATHAGDELGGQRNTTLAQCAVDLFACAGAMAFKGTGASSFSTLVQRLRVMGGWWAH